MKNQKLTGKYGLTYLANMSWYLAETRILIILCHKLKQGKGNIFVCVIKQQILMTIAFVTYLYVQLSIKSSSGYETVELGPLTWSVLN
jgi:hypothetical protein